MIINGIESPHFKLSEFACKCDCGLANPNPRLVRWLNRAREIADVPFVVTSGSRCRDHDRETYEKLGKKWPGMSSHLPKGDDRFTDAVDIRTLTSGNRFVILGALLEAGFKRIGFGNGFIHADVDVHKMDEVMWDYYKKEK